MKPAVPLKKLTWQERCTITNNYHVARVKVNKNWTVRDTARELNRSIGSISEDLQLASWLKTHPQLEKEKYLVDALAFIRDKKQEMRLRA